MERKCVLQRVGQVSFHLYLRIVTNEVSNDHGPDGQLITLPPDCLVICAMAHVNVSDWVVATHLTVDRPLVLFLKVFCFCRQPLNEIKEH